MAEWLKTLCLFTCFVIVCSNSIEISNRNEAKNTSYVNVMIRPLKRKLTKVAISQNQHTKHNPNKVAQTVDNDDNRANILNATTNLLQNIGINLTSKQTNKLYNIIPKSQKGVNNVFRVILYPKNSNRTQLNATGVSSYTTITNKEALGATRNSTQQSIDDDDCTRPITLLDKKSYKLNNALLDRTYKKLPQVDHGSFQSGKSFDVSFNEQYPVKS